MTGGVTIEGDPVDFTFVMLESEECVVRANPAGDLACYRDHKPGPDGHYFLTMVDRQLLMRRANGQEDNPV